MMIIKRKTIRIWLAAFLPFALIALFAFYRVDKENRAKYNASTNQHIGQVFSIGNLLDTNGLVIKPRFNNTELTIVDFWFKGCKPCIKEMRQFEALIRGKENQVSILSISLDPFDYWKPVFEDRTTTLSFLSKNISNWQHLVLIPDDSTLNPFTLLSKKFNVASYPSYFVIDKKGVIVATPSSAVEYLKTETGNHTAFGIFLVNRITSPEAFTGALLLFVFYSGLFWIVTIIVLSIKQKVNPKP